MSSITTRERLIARALRLQRFAQINAPNVLVRTEAWIIFRDLCGSTLQAILWSAKYCLWKFLGDVSFSVHVRACRLGRHWNYFGGYCACGEVGQSSDEEQLSLFDDLEKLRLRHYVCDGDYWYSCPASGSCCDDRADAGDTTCDCGADEHNAILDMVIEEVQELLGKRVFR